MGETTLWIWSQYSTQFVSTVLTLITAAVYWVLQAHAKVRWGVQHGFAHRLTNRTTEDGKALPPLLVYSSAILLVNTGRLAAKNVEVTLNFQPDSLAVWPQRQYSRALNPDDRMVVNFVTLAPREQISINLLTVGAEIPDVLSVRAENSTPLEIPLVPARAFSKPVMRLIAIIMLLGIGAATYLLIATIAFLASIGM